ncbi:hypothetical protein ACH5RR_037205 [Cinchona calisaya]|uniref:Uncharacterized protein n=1 Tax=Cinchona calisaya TaxID=153742 RepID=A0ABD2Y6V9_9GENT
MSSPINQPPRSKSIDMPPPTSHLSKSMPFSMPTHRSLSPTFVPFSMPLPMSQSPIMPPLTSYLSTSVPFSVPLPISQAPIISSPKSQPPLHGRPKAFNHLVLTNTRVVGTIGGCTPLNTVIRQKLESARYLSIVVQNA